MLRCGRRTRGTGCCTDDHPGGCGLRMGVVLSQEQEQVRLSGRVQSQDSSISLP